MKRWVIALVILPLFFISTWGMEAQEEFTELRRAAGEYGAVADPEEGVDLETGLAALWDTAREHMNSILRETLGSCVLLLAVVLICGLAQESFGAFGGDKFSLVRLVGTLGITAIAVSDTGALIGSGRHTIGEVDAFSDALLPAVAMVTATAGAPAGAAARQMATMLFSDMLILLIDRLLLPGVYAYVALSAAGTATGNDGLKRIAGFLKWAVTSALTAVLLAFVSYLSLSSAIAGSADAVTVKTAKMTISGTIPVVGGILADAAETVLVGAGILKNTVGVFGMLVVLCMCVVPFLQLGIHYIAYRLTGALAATVGDPKLTGLIDSIGSAFGLILGMTGSCTFLLLISLVSAVMLVVR